jgi:glycosyltransferase involved in cell wall biosynthesis
MNVKEISEDIISHDGHNVSIKGPLGDLSLKIDVSIVMTYFERKNQLFNTIKSFSMNGYEGVELIIIDDGSVEQPVTVEELSCLAPKLDIHLIRIEPAEKKYFNPCIPFNQGFAEARGSIIIIQNTECIHVGDIVSYCRKNLDNSKYFSFGCFSIDQEAMMQISNKEKFDRIFLEKYISRNEIVSADGEIGWYNHSVFRPAAYHFTAALTRDNLDLLKGFDTRYAYGIGHDDDEFIERIRRSRMKIEIIDDVTVLHQWHYSMTKNLRFDKLFTRNRLLLKLVTKRENKISYSRFSIRYLCFLIMLPILSIIVKFVDRKRILKRGVILK